MRNFRKAENVLFWAVPIINSRAGSVHRSVHVFLPLAALFHGVDGRVGGCHVWMDIALRGAELRVPHDLLDDRGSDVPQSEGRGRCVPAGVRL